MSVREVTYYQAVCDWPGCTATAHDGTDYAAYGSPDSAMVDVEDGGWFRDATEGDRFYCGLHPAAWASDHEDGEPFPEPPYLLIHDGDTDNADNDGKVSLIGGEQR